MLGTSYDRLACLMAALGRAPQDPHDLTPPGYFSSHSTTSSRSTAEVPHHSSRTRALLRVLSNAASLASRRSLEFEPRRLCRLGHGLGQELSETSDTTSCEMLMWSGRSGSPICPSVAFQSQYHCLTQAIKIQRWISNSEGESQRSVESLHMSTHFIVELDPGCPIVEVDNVSGTGE